MLWVRLILFVSHLIRQSTPSHFDVPGLTLFISKEMYFIFRLMLFTSRLMYGSTPPHFKISRLTLFISREILRSTPLTL